MAETATIQKVTAVVAKTGGVSLKFAALAIGGTLVAGGVTVAVASGAGGGGTSQAPGSAIEAPAPTLGPGIDKPARSSIAATRTPSELSLPENVDLYRAVQEFRAGLRAPLALQLPPKSVIAVPAQPTPPPQDPAALAEAPTPAPSAEAGPVEPEETPLPRAVPAAMDSPTEALLKVLESAAPTRDRFDAFRKLSPMLAGDMPSVLVRLSALLGATDNVALEWMIARRLQELTGKSYGRDAQAWREWFAGTTAAQVGSDV
jgi:hypothetical protein